MKIVFFIILMIGISFKIFASDQLDRSWAMEPEAIDEMYGDSAIDRGAKMQMQSLVNFREQARQVEVIATRESVLVLGGALVKLAQKNLFQLRERIETYDLVQQTVIATAGHARYFADEIRRGQSDVLQSPNDGGLRISYNRSRIKYLGILAHLPSPESIAVLGEFLSDDIDTPIPLVYEGSDTGERLRANSFGASAAISEIGLRDAPAGKGTYDADPDAHLARTRAWWEEVKSGKKSFSFKGQSVEYRFNPDGTWQTIALKNPPNDALEAEKSVVKVQPPVKQPQGSQARKDGAQLFHPWQWLLGLGVVFLSLFALILRRFKRH